jgi:hypothetical protein
MIKVEYFPDDPYGCERRNEIAGVLVLIHGVDDAMSEKGA